jgi:hypothetical protein
MLILTIPNINEAIKPKKENMQTKKESNLYPNIMNKNEKPAKIKV